MRRMVLAAGVLCAQVVISVAGAMALWRWLAEESVRWLWMAAAALAALLGLLQAGLAALRARGTSGRA